MSPSDIEQIVAGMILAQPDRCAEANALGISARHFNDAFLGKLVDTVSGIWSAGQLVDIVGLCRALGQEHASRLMALRSNAPSTQNFTVYAQALVDATRSLEIQSRLADVSRRLSHRKPLESLSPILHDLSMAAAISGEVQAVRAVSIDKAIDKSIGAVEAKLAGTRGIPTGFHTLDDEIYGWQPEFVYVIGARTGIGKTTIALNCAIAAAKASYRTAYFTVEMSAADVADKIMVEASGVNITALLSGHLSEQDIQRLIDTAPSLAQLPLDIVEVDKPDIGRIEAEAARQVRANGAKLIFVDYLQLFEIGDERFRPSREEAKAVSARLKQLAKSLKVPIVVLSQLNRLAPEGQKPDLVHIAESDQVARDADVVLFLWHNPENEYFLTVSKNRRGRCGTLPLNAQLQFSRFRVHE